jgi:protein-tyrosine phosphatase
MNRQPYSRQIGFESIANFRDLGGYHTSDGKTVTWRRIFRSGQLHEMTQNDFKQLGDSLGLAAVIDLRSTFEIERQGIGLLSGSDIKYHNISFISDGGNRTANEIRYKGLTDMSGLYLNLMRQKDFGKRLVEALEIISATENQPLVFHCSAGKDRTAILAAILLGVLGVKSQDIIEDFCLSAPYSEVLKKRMEGDPRWAKDAKALPDFFWKVSPDSMALFLSALNKEHGSIRGYLEAQGAESSLVFRLERALLN